ncbi:unnamed protein product [Cyprideis torosa]|uniref:Uncharacterized protein n=1 Tax=Cyprideis torosa TaxID=163714 RepID=A0A7R8WG42_9CRUS|nr:unnamed protein product [Cyprideis torosa]CAG0892507.1 unnamed protein product [Cyprideis torosa]
MALRKALRHFALFLNKPCVNVRLLSTYNAVVVSEFGKELTVQEQRRSKLGEDEIRVAVHNCALNSMDLLDVNGRGYDKKGIKPPFVPGFEISGSVLELGSEVKGFKVDDRLIALNKDKLGGLAEECVVSVKDAFLIDQGMRYENCAALLDSYATAYLALNQRARLSEGQVVLVTAASGGLGLAAVDLAANSYMCKVIGVCRTEDRSALVREKGAWAALSFDKSHLRKKVKELTSGAGVDLIFEAVGGEVFDAALECAAFESKVIVAGFASQQIPTIRTSALLPKSVSLIGVSLTHYRWAKLDVYRSACEEVIALFRENQISPHISAIFPITKLNEALTYIREEKSSGKVLIDCRLSAAQAVKFPAQEQKQ